MSWPVKHPELSHSQNHITLAINHLLGTSSDGNMRRDDRRSLLSVLQSNHGFESLRPNSGTTNVEGRSIRPSPRSTPPNGSRYPTRGNSFTEYKPLTGREDPEKGKRPWTGRRMRELYDNSYTKDELIAEFSKVNGTFAAD
ncbi:hypothetical protein ACHAQE_011111 [Botrytis cinerea]